MPLDSLKALALTLTDYTPFAPCELSLAAWLDARRDECHAIASRKKIAADRARFIEAAGHYAALGHLVAAAEAVIAAEPSRGSLTPHGALARLRQALLRDASCQFGIPCGAAEQCPDPVGCGLCAAPR